MTIRPVLIRSAENERREGELSQTEKFSASVHYCQPGHKNFSGRSEGFHSKSPSACNRGPSVGWPAWKRVQLIGEIWISHICRFNISDNVADASVFTERTHRTDTGRDLYSMTNFTPFEFLFFALRVDGSNLLNSQIRRRGFIIFSSFPRRTRINWGIIFLSGWSPPAIIYCHVQSRRAPGKAPDRHRFRDKDPVAAQSVT
jgi:hypothetical protein